LDDHAAARSYAAAAALAAVAYLGLTWIQATNPTFDAFFTTPLDWANELTFTAALLGSVTAMAGLVRLGLVPTRSGLAFVVGHGLVLLGMLAGLPLGHAPDWFAAVGVPGNLLALGGMVGVAMAAWRTGTWPRWVAVLMPLSVLLGVGLAEQGGSVFAAVLWAAIAYRLAAPQRSVVMT
jgi:hypothetical protein